MKLKLEKHRKSKKLPLILYNLKQQIGAKKHNKLSEIILQKKTERHSRIRHAELQYTAGS